MLPNMKEILFILAGLGAIFNGVICQVIVNGKTGSFIGTQDETLRSTGLSASPTHNRPIGKLRLHTPQAILNNLGTVNVQGPTSNKCYGIENNLLRVSSEDCLHVDVVRPSDNQPLLPVFVFLHGGDFDRSDKSDIDGGNLVSRATSFRSPFIFVSVNYRLSFLGFPGGLEAGKHGAHNLGLHDQCLARQWVKENIQDFGGDANKVVLGGQASGADAVAYQMLAYGGHNQNLFRGLFLESGAATGMTSIPYPNYKSWQTNYDTIVTQTQCNNVPTDAFHCLQVLPIDVLTNAMYDIFAKSYTIPHHVYAPVIDDTFLQAYPSVLMAQGKFAALPTVIGHTTNELIGRAPQNRTSAQTLASLTLPLIFSTMFLLRPSRSSSLSTQPPSFQMMDQQALGLNSAALYKSIMSCNPSAQSTELHFSSLRKLLSTNRWDACHSTSTASPFLKVSQGQDLPFFFGTSSNNATPDDMALANRYQHYLAAFITSLNPNGLRVSIYDSIWVQYNNASQNQLVFGTVESGGVRTEKDGVNIQRCDFIDAHNLDFLR